METCLQRITAGRNEKPNDFEQQLFLEKAHAIFASLEFPWLKQVDCSGAIDDVASEIDSYIQPLCSGAIDDVASEIDSYIQPLLIQHYGSKEAGS